MRKLFLSLTILLFLASNAFSWTTGSPPLGDTIISGGLTVDGPVSINDSALSILSEKYKANEVDVRVAPSHSAAEIMAENVWLEASTTETSFLAYANNAAIRHRGTITKVKFALDSGITLSNLITFKIQIWRYMEVDTCGGGAAACFDLVGQTDNICGSNNDCSDDNLTAGAVNTVDITDIEGVVPGDFYAVVLDVTAGTEDTINYMIVSTAGDNEGFSEPSATVTDVAMDWVNAGTGLVGIPMIEIVMSKAPQVAFLGCSHLTANAHVGMYIDDPDASGGVFMSRDFEMEAGNLLERITGMTTQNLSVNGAETHEMIDILTRDLTALAPRILVTDMAMHNMIVETAQQSRTNSIEDGSVWDDYLNGTNNSGENGAYKLPMTNNYSFNRIGVFDGKDGVSSANDTITFESAHGLSTGDSLKFRDGGNIPTGVTALTGNYWAITGSDCDTACGTTVIEVASTRANALAGTEIDLTASGTGSKYNYAAASTRCSAAPCYNILGQFTTLANWAKNNDVLLVINKPEGNEKATYLDVDLAHDHAIIDIWWDSIKSTVSAIYPETIFFDLPRDYDYYSLVAILNSAAGTTDLRWSTGVTHEWGDIAIPATAGTTCDFSDGTQPIFRATSCADTWGTDCDTHATTEPTWNCGLGETTVDNASITWTMIGYTDLATFPAWGVAKEYLILGGDDQHRTDSYYRYYVDVLYKSLSNQENSVNSNNIVSQNTAQTVAASDVILADKCGGVKKITSASSVTTNTTDTLSRVTQDLDGCRMTILNVGSYPISLDRNNRFIPGAPNTGGAGNVIVTPNTAVDVSAVYDEATPKWYALGIRMPTGGFTQSVNLDAATTFEVVADHVFVNPDGPETLTTITGGTPGQKIALCLVDTDLTITDTEAATANTINLEGTSNNITSNVNTCVSLINDGTKWYQTGISLNRSRPDFSATPIDATRATVPWEFTFDIGDDTDGTCDLSGGQADCFTLPDPTTHGTLTCTIKGTDTVHTVYFIGSAGETTEISDLNNNVEDTDTCAGGATGKVCIYDSGTNAVVHNDLGQAETIICRIIYD